MEDQDQYSKEFIERVKSREDKLKLIEIATKVEMELQQSIVWPIILDATKQDADEALTELATVDPADYKKIIALQAKVYCSTMLVNLMIGIRNRGAWASKELVNESEEELPDGQSTEEN